MGGVAETSRGEAIPSCVSEMRGIWKFKKKGSGEEAKR